MSLRLVHFRQPPNTIDDQTAAEVPSRARCKIHLLAANWWQLLLPLDYNIRAYVIENVFESRLLSPGLEMG